MAAAIAAVPAIVAYGRGRQAARFADDPALPERLFAGRRVTSRALFLPIVMLAVLTGRAAVWAIPLALIGYLAGGFPARRILFNETWSLPAYLSFKIRFFIAFYSFWILVCALPSLVLWADDRLWIVAALLGTGLTILASRQTDAIRWLLRTKPIEDDALRARFDRLAAACGLPAPRFEVIDLKGGSMANAFALSSLGRSAVLFTGPLLQRLEADEADAICAHELAHLEYYNSRRLRQRRLISRSLIAAGALLTPLVHLLAPSVAWMLGAVWPVGVLFAVAALVRDRQKHETASDLRAVALTGNPEALVRGLVKVHAMARVPRRWDADLERHMSHPSLKRRIQDIRAAAGTPPATLGDSAVFESADGAIRVVFGAESLEWIEGTSASFRLGYDRLRELRVAATRAGDTNLLAADRGGHRWHMPLRVEDVPRLQAALDVLDARVGTGGPPVPVFQPLLIRGATLVVAIVSINVGMIGAAMVAALTLIRPAAQLFGAAGLAAVGASLLSWRDSGGGYGLMPVEYQAIFGAVLFAAGATLVWIAYTRRFEEVGPRATRLVALVGAAALAAWLLPVLIGGAGAFDAVGLYQAARDWPSSVVLPLAVAGALMWSPRTSRRAAATAAVLASVAAATVGSQAFLDRFGGDPFLVPVPEIRVRTLDRATAEFTVPFSVSGLELSPDGRSIAVVSQQPGSRPEILIGRAGGALTTVEGDQASFVDDDHAIVWAVDGSRTTLREVLTTRPSVPEWRLEVTGLTAPALSLDAKSKRWRLASPGVDAVETREGVIGTVEIESHRWPVAAGHGAPVVPIAVAGDRALAVEPRADLLSLTNPLAGLVIALASTPRMRSTIWALGPDGAVELSTSRLELACQRLSTVGTCQMFDASRTRFFSMDAGTRGFTAAASLSGRFFATGESHGPWVTGWYRAGLVAVRLAPASAIQVIGPGGEHPHMLAASDRAAAGVWYQPTATSLVRIYGVE
jgi:heat shock protein HtpX